MSKIELNPLASGNSVSTLNSNFQKIEDALNTQVLYRDNPEGEPNELQNDIDVNGKNLYNAGMLSVSSLQVGGVSLEPGDSLSAATLQPFEFVATAGQTVFSVSPFTPTSTSLLVSVNGVDYPTSSISVTGSSVTLLACEANDEVVIRVFTRPVGGAPIITGSRASGAALTSLLQGLAAAGIIVNNTVA